LPVALASYGGMTGADAKVAADFKAVWDQFKATREKGNADDAKKIADGIQAKRLSKMWGIMSCKVMNCPTHHLRPRRL
jgi:hypothetical protein